MQVEESFRKYAQARADSRSSPVYGGVPLEPQEKKLRAGVDVVVATPGRLIDHLERQNVVFDDLEVLVLDEADRMLDMGFAPQINRIVERDADVPADAALQRDDAARGRGARAQVSAQAGRRAGRAALGGREHGDARGLSGAARAEERAARRAARRGRRLDSVLIFTRTKHGADRVVRHLEKAGISATAMHADKTQAQRTRALEDFKDGQDPRARRDRHRAARARHLRHHARHQLRRAAAARGLRAPHRPHGPRGEATGDAYTFMAPDEIAMVRTIERVIGQPIPRISVPGYDFGTVAAD